MSTVYLVRHGAAADRARWSGDDRLRPLTSKGVAQAHALASVIALGDVLPVRSSPYVRCIQTLRPLAERMATTVVEDVRLGEDARLRDLAGAVEELRTTGGVICSHGNTIPAILDALASEMDDHEPFTRCRKASVWCLHSDGERFVRATYIDAPEV